MHARNPALNGHVVGCICGAEAVRHELETLERLLAQHGESGPAQMSRPLFKSVVRTGHTLIFRPLTSSQVTGNANGHRLCEPRAPSAVEPGFVTDAEQTGLGLGWRE